MFMLFRNPKWKHHEGPVSTACEEDPKALARKQNDRKNGIIKKCKQLVDICGGQVFFRYTSQEQRSYIFTNDEEQYKAYKDTGLRPLKSECRVTVEGN